jgi:hypothetical protein
MTLKAPGCPSAQSAGEHAIRKTVRMALRYLIGACINSVALPASDRIKSIESEGFWWLSWHSHTSPSNLANPRPKTNGSGCQPAARTIDRKCAAATNGAGLQEHIISKGLIILQSNLNQARLAIHSPYRAAQPSASVTNYFLQFDNRWIKKWIAEV